MKQTEWKIIYTKYEGVLKRAIHLLSKEAGKFLIREPNVYKIYVLPCEKEGCEISKNAFFVGCYDDSEVIRQYVKADEVPEKGYLVKVIKNPADEDGRFVILTARSEQEVFYSAVSFIDDYIPLRAPAHGANRMPDLIFDSPLEEDSYTEVPDNQTRCIFTWGHVINDYRLYIDNIARMKYNELIIWNNYLPLNISDVIDYAHSYGIKVILGYTWGWLDGYGSKVKDISDARLEELKKSIIEEYERDYASTNCDGIYFQSFTESFADEVGGRSIAEAVTALVNMTAKELYAKYPNLYLQFGLHATSVKNRLDVIETVDPRIDIIWEDCGEFPHHYCCFVRDEKLYAETLEFVKKILHLRGGKGVGFLYKGVMMMDWNRFIYQSGPFILGENAEAIKSHDRQIRANAWREYSADWIHHGDRAHEMTRFIKENKIGEVIMGLAGTFDGGIYLPVALCGQMFRNCNEEYKDVVKKTTRRACIAND